MISTADPTLFDVEVPIVTSEIDADLRAAIQLNSLRVVRRMCKAAEVPRIRTRREFAEAEIWVPEGKRAKRKFSCKVQPFAGVILDAMDSGNWRRFFGTGCVQSGKTLLFVVIPVLYHLFELKETVIVGAPNMEVCKDKWRKEIKPCIMANPRLARLMPTSGPGSDGGFAEEIEFENGASLKFMSAGGSDVRRSGYTARVVVATELDKQDVSTESSRETDPVSQYEARSESYADLALFYGECTTSFETGRIWKEVKKGTQSRLVSQCGHCKSMVTPEKEHFLEADGQPDEFAARENAHFVCPSCADPIDDAKRLAMNRDIMLLHEGQEVTPEGTIIGEAKRTLTFSVRWNAYNNLFWDNAHIASTTYNKENDDDEEAAERYMDQFVWVRPWKPDRWTDMKLSGKELRNRQSPWRQFLCPPGTDFLTVGVDIQRHLLYYVVIAWREKQRGNIVDYGELTFPDPDTHGDEVAIFTGLKRLEEEHLAPGYREEVEEGEDIIHHPLWAALDAGWQTDTVFSFALNQKIAGNNRYLPCFGRGTAQQATRRYAKPPAKSKPIDIFESETEIRFDTTRRMHYAINNSDFHKTWLVRRFIKQYQEDTPSTISLFRVPSPKKHTTFCRHLSAESWEQEAVPGKGVVIKWTNSSHRHNHYNDATYQAAAMYQMVVEGRKRKEKQEAAEHEQDQQNLQSESQAEPYLVIDR